MYTIVNENGDWFEVKLSNGIHCEKPKAAIDKHALLLWQASQRIEGYVKASMGGM